jgi:hypothetical protein
LPDKALHRIRQRHAPVSLVVSDSTYLSGTMAIDMKTRELARLFLLAWHESIKYQSELLPALADTLDVSFEDIYYHWAIPPYHQQTNIVRSTKWQYFFHGKADCDLMHTEDGRFLQISIGPHGRHDTFSGWGTMLFVMASKSPWSEFSELKYYLADEAPPYNHLSGSHKKMSELAYTIEMLGLFEVADRKLTQLKIKLREEFTYIDDEGRHIFSPPAPYNDFTSQMYWDLEVCDVLVLSNLGKQMFACNLDIEHFSELWEKRVINAAHKAI